MSSHDQGISISTLFCGVAAIAGYAIYKAVKYHSQIEKTRYVWKAASQKITSEEDLARKKQGDLVMMTGKLDADNCINWYTFQEGMEDKTKKNIAQLLLHFTYREPLYSNQSKHLEYKLGNIKIQIPKKIDEFFCAKNIFIHTEKGSKIQIRNLEMINYQNALDFVGSKKDQYDIGFFRWAACGCFRIIRGIATIFILDPDVTFFKGLEVGTREVDAGITIGAKLSVLGKLGITTNDNKFFIDLFQIFKDKSEFVRNLDKKLKALTSSRNLWAGIGILLSIYLINVGINAWSSQERQRKKKDYSSDSLDSSDSSDDYDPRKQYFQHSH